MSNFDVYEAEMCSSLRKKYRLNIEKASFSTNSIPNYILLDSTRNIHSYLEFCQKEGNSLVSAHWGLQDQLKGVLSVVRTQYSQLDRPLFFIFPDEKGTLYIIESTDVREHLLEDRDEHVTSFMIDNANKFQDMFKQIYDEL